MRNSWSKEPRQPCSICSAERSIGSSSGWSALRPRRRTGSRRAPRARGCRTSSSTRRSVRARCPSPTSRNGRGRAPCRGVRSRPSSVRSASAARAACQWKAPPSSTSTPSVTAKRVVICVTLRFQPCSRSLRSWTTARHAGMRIETEHDGEGVAPVGELGELHVPLVLARRQEPRRRQDLEQRSPAQRIVPRQHRADHAARVGEQERAVEGTVGQRHRRLDVLLQRRPRRAVGSDAGAERHAEPSRRDLRMENGQAVVLDDVRAAADRQLQDERRPEGGEEECDQDGDEVAKRTLRNGDARPAWRGDGKPELSFLEEKFAELRFCHRVPLTPGKLCSWSLFLIATPFTDEESLQLFESNRGCLVQYSGGSPEACEGCPSPPTWEPCESRHRARHDLVGVAR